MADWVMFIRAAASLTLRKLSRWSSATRRLRSSLLNRMRQAEG